MMSDQNPPTAAYKTLATLTERQRGVLLGKEQQLRALGQEYEEGLAQLRASFEGRHNELLRQRDELLVLVFDAHDAPDTARVNHEKGTLEVLEDGDGEST
jgi:hypothetical protein